MSHLTIKDLNTSYELDQSAATAILGGINEWIHIPMPTRAFSPMSFTVFNIQTTYNTYNTYNDNDYTLSQPQFFNVGNGVENSGSMSFSFNPLNVSAASPSYVIA